MSRRSDIPDSVHAAAVEAARVAALAYEPRLRFEAWMCVRAPKDARGRDALPPSDFKERSKWMAMSTARWAYQKSVIQWRKDTSTPA